MNNNGGFDEEDEDDEGKLKEGWKNSLTQTLRNGMKMNGELKFRFQSPYVDLILGTVAAAAQVHLDPL